MMCVLLMFHKLYIFVTIVIVFFLISILQEKQRAKIKEKLDKCIKEKLLDFCDVLNIPINKANIKKVCIHDWSVSWFMQYI